MSLSGTLEKGAHHQALDLSEELPPHHHHHHHHANHHQHLHHSGSLASTTAVGGGRETPPRGVVVPPPYSAAESGGGGSEAPLELRGSLDCWACSVLVTAQNLVIAAINACLAGVVFGTILIPAIAMVVFGFLCHSTVRPHGTTPYCSELLTDGGCVALLSCVYLAEGTVQGGQGKGKSLTESTGLKSRRMKIRLKQSCTNTEIQINPLF
uniref:Transmembrane protein 88-like n=1 Tax=Salarias fasciatus TaxID=181472 RepID=A0A672GBC1_SALFA